MLSNILDKISFGLTKLSEKGEVSPNLAEKWSVSDGGKTYRFSISEETFIWHDKKTFSVQDINYNFKDVTMSYEGNDVIFVLKEPFSPFPSVVFDIPPR